MGRGFAAHVAASPSARAGKGEGPHGRRLRSAAVALAAALALLSAGAAGRAATRELVGKRAPDFSGTQVSGEPLSFSSFAGRSPVILTFWSIYCKSCTEELSALQLLVEKHGPGKVAVLAVNEDADVGVGRVQSFLEQYASAHGVGALTFPLFFDAKGEVFRKYSVARLPTLFYIDRDGTVREVIEGYEQGREQAVFSAIEKLLAEVSPETLKEVAGEAFYDLDVVVPICGVYRDGKWYRPLDLDESGRPEAIARARARGEEHLRREAIRLALADLGMTLHGDGRIPECGVPYGMEIRTPRVPADTIDLLLERLNLPRVVEVVSEETIERNRDLVLFRRMKVVLPALMAQMSAGGYETRESSVRVRFVRASPLDERTFVDAVLAQLPYLSEIRKVRSSKGGAEYLVTAHASPETVAQALRGLDVGARKMSVDLLPGNIVEVAMWR